MHKHKNQFMDLLEEVANISGKPGLFRVVKPGRVGVIVESLDSDRKREMINANAKVSILKEISVYTEDVNKSLPLADIFTKIKADFGDDLKIDIKTADNKAIFAFFEKVMPDFDRERVYATDVKKIITWYKILLNFLPEIFEAPKAS